MYRKVQQVHIHHLSKYHQNRVGDNYGRFRVSVKRLPWLGATHRAKDPELQCNVTS